MRRATLTIALVLTACGTRPETPTDPLAAYPEDRFIVAEGQGPTALAAADDARIRVSAQIRARMTGRLTVETRQSDLEAHERVEHQLITETTFDRAELIRVPRALQTCARPNTPDGCMAVAVLDRAEASEALRSAAADASFRFRSAAGAAVFSGQRQWIAFTGALRRAEREYAEVARAGWQRVAIEGGVPEDFAHDRNVYLALLTNAGNRLARLNISVQPALGFDGPWATRVEDAILEGLSRLGPIVHRGECRSRQGGLLARPRGEVVCRRGGLGPACRLTLKVQLTYCGGGELVTVEPPAIAAVDPRTEERARERLAGEVTGDRLEPLLQRGLVGVLPVDPPLDGE